MSSARNTEVRFKGTLAFEDVAAAQRLVEVSFCFHFLFLSLFTQLSPGGQQHVGQVDGSVLEGEWRNGMSAEA